MSMKILFSILFASAVICASTAQEAEGAQVRRASPVDEFAQWWNGVENKIDGWLGSLAVKIKNFWSKLTGQDKQKREELLRLKREYEKLQQLSTASINQARQKWEKEINKQEKSIAEIKEEADKEIQAEIDKWDKKFKDFMNDNRELVKSLES